ncbi:hypothetical protein HDV02_002512 [Globomyces sp. JEL0801]|nr:hypothetical protein HDV02_002512 [Globomyces sp. JEL0801]
MLSSTQNTIHQINPSISSTFDNVQKHITKGIDTVVQSVDFNDLDSTGSVPNLNDLADAMDTTADDISNVIVSISHIQEQRDTIAFLVTDMSYAINSIMDSISSWGDSGNPLIDNESSTLYTLSLSINLGLAAQKAAESLDSVNNAATGNSAASSLQDVPDLHEYATKIRDAIDTIQQKSITVRISGADIKKTIVDALQKTKVDVSKTIVTVEAELDKSIVSAQTSSQSAFRYNSTIQTYMYIIPTKILRGYVVYGISGWMVLMVLVILFSMMIRQPGAAKGYSILAFSMGDGNFTMKLICLVCVSMFETSPPAIAKALDKQTGDTIIKAMNAKGKCLNDGSLLDVVSDLGFISSSMLNFTAAADTQLKKVNLLQITKNLNTDSITSQESPESQLVALTSIDLTAFDSSSLEKVRVDTLPSLVQELEGLIQRLNDVKQQASDNPNIAFNYISGSYQPTVLSSFLSTVDATIDQINVIIDPSSGNVRMIDDEIAVLIERIMNGRDSVETLQINGEMIQPIYDDSIVSLTKFVNHAKTNVTNGFKKATIDILEGMNVEKTKLFAAVQCKEIAQSFNSVQNLLCVKLEDSLDILWFGYAVFGIVAFVSMPGIIYATNRFLAKKYAQKAELENSKGKGKDYPGNAGTNQVIGTEQYSSPLTTSPLAPVQQPPQIMFVPVVMTSAPVALGGVSPLGAEPPNMNDFMRELQNRQAGLHARSPSQHEDHLQWISQQKMFFIASASCKSNTRVNVSPKGYESIKVSQSNVYFLDLTGSGAETITHVNENQRLTFMFCAFEGSPRSIIVGDIIQSAHSCGFGVPFYEYVGPRDTLNKYWSAKDQMYITDYWKAKNTKSVDGLYVHGYPNIISRLLSMKYESSLVIGGIAIGVLLGMKLTPKTPILNNINSTAKPIPESSSGIVPSAQFPESSNKSQTRLAIDPDDRDYKSKTPIVNRMQQQESPSRRLSPKKILTYLSLMGLFYLGYRMLYSDSLSETLKEANGDQKVIVN